MVMAQRINLRLNVDADLHTKWTDMCDRKRITQQDAIEAVLEWFLGQDDLAQSGVLGQIALVPRLIHILIERAAPTARIRGSE